MPVTLAKIIYKIQLIPNSTNAQLVKEMYEYLKSNGVFERHQHNALKVMIPFANYLGPYTAFFDINSKEEILAFLDAKKRNDDDEEGTEKKWVTTWNSYLVRIKYFIFKYPACYSNNGDHKTSMNVHNAEKLDIARRRQQVASMLRRSKTQEEIAKALGCDQTTVSLDVKALREASKNFVFELAKSDLASYYKSCLDGIEEAKREAWLIYEREWTDEFAATKYKLAALKVVIQAEEAKFKLLTEGPSVLAINSMTEKLNQIEHDFQENNR